MTSLQPGPPGSQSRRALRTVLVVEDDQDVADSISEVVEDQGYRALWAANGRDALTLLEKHEPALVLVDLFMPVMNGIELLRAMRRSDDLKHIARVVLTAANDQMIAVKEDVPVLYKPVDFEALVQVLRKYCGDPYLSGEQSERAIP